MKLPLVLLCISAAFATEISVIIYAYSEENIPGTGYVDVYDKEPPRTDDIFLLSQKIEYEKHQEVHITHFEFSGIDPYIKFFYTKNDEHHKMVIPICDNCVFSRTFLLLINMDNHYYVLEEVRF